MFLCKIHVIKNLYILQIPLHYLECFLNYHHCATVSMNTCAQGHFFSTLDAQAPSQSSLPTENFEDLKEISQNSHGYLLRRVLASVTTFLFVRNGISRSHSRQNCKREKARQAKLMLFLTTLVSKPFGMSIEPSLAICRPQ